MSRPVGLFLVTDSGDRIPIDLKFDYIDDDGIRHWNPVIEGDLNRVMPDVIAFDGPPVSVGECISFAEAGHGWDTAEWGERVMANSRHVFGFYVPGHSS